jgi:hypothetical protein
LIHVLKSVILLYVLQQFDKIVSENIVFIILLVFNYYNNIYVCHIISTYITQILIKSFC